MNLATVNPPKVPGRLFKTEASCIAIAQQYDTLLAVCNGCGSVYQCLPAVNAIDRSYCRKSKGKKQY